MSRPREKRIPLETAQGQAFPIRSCFKGWFCWVFHREPQDGGRSYLLRAEFSPPFPEGRQIWGAGTAPAQMAASSWLWHGEGLTLGCWLPGPSRFPSNAGARPLERRERESPAMPAAPRHPDLAGSGSRHPGLQPREQGEQTQQRQPAASASLSLPSLWLARR